MLPSVAPDHMQVAVLSFGIDIAKKACSKPRNAIVVMSSVLVFLDWHSILMLGCTSVMQ